MTDALVVHDLRVAAHVGVTETERAVAQALSIDLVAERPLERAGATDDLGQTTDYGALLAAVERAARAAPHHLLESLGERVARAVLEFDAAITAVEVTVRKVTPPVPQRVSGLGVRLRRDRS